MNRCSGVLENRAGHLGIQSVAAAIGRQTTADVQTDQRKITDHVQYLVPGTFVVETESILNGAVFAKNQNFVITDITAKPLFAQQVGFGLQQKRPCRGDFAPKTLRTDDQAALLCTDRRLPIVQLVVDFEVSRTSWLALDPAFLVSHPNNRVDQDLLSLDLLFLSFRMQQHFDKLLAGAITTGHLGSINVDFAIVDLQTGQCGHDVFDHFHGVPPLDQSGSSSPPNTSNR